MTRWALVIQGIGIIINQRTWTSRAKWQWNSDGFKENNVEDGDVCHSDAFPDSCQSWSRPEQCSESWMHPWGKAEGTFFITFFLLDMNETQNSSVLCLIVKVKNDRAETLQSVSFCVIPLWQIYTPRRSNLTNVFSALFQAICLATDYSTFDLPIRTECNEIKIGERYKKREKIDSKKIRYWLNEKHLTNRIHLCFKDMFQPVEIKVH